MRIVVNGQQAFGKAVLEALIERGHEVVAVYSAPEKPGQKPDPLTEAAREHGITLHQPRSFKTPEVAATFKELKPDLCVMAYVILLVPETILNLPTHGTIQYHPSLLPKHRGPSSINWPIIQGETRTGLTIFWPDEGLDTGPIFLQKEVPIGPDDTLGSIYFDHLFPMGVAALLEGVDLVKSGKAHRETQDEAHATYEGWCRKQDAEIDWSKPFGEVYNLIRGTNPQPGAWTTHQGKTVQVFDAAQRKTKGGTPGEITAVDDEGITVAATGGQIQILRVRPEGEKKVPAGEFASGHGLRIGDRLGSA